MRASGAWTWRVGLLMLLGLAACAGAHAAETCPSCAGDAWAAAPPFETSNRWFNPYTLGLPAGAQAPAITGVTFTGRRTVLYIATSFSEEAEAVLGELAAIDGLQVVGVSAGTATSVAAPAALGRATIVGDPTANIARAMYYIGEHPMAESAAFLIDERGVIVHRELGDILWLAYENDRTARAFATKGVLPDDVPAQTVLIRGEPAPWPPFMLYDLDGREVTLGPGQVRLFYNGESPVSGRGELVFNDLDVLQREFPDVEFVWIVRYASREKLSEMWHIYNRTGLGAFYPEWFSLPLEEYATRCVEQQAVGLTALVGEIRQKAPEWTTLWDADSELTRFWAVTTSGAVWILDGEGKVLLPFTLYPTEQSDGLRVHPQAAEALRQILREATSSQAG